MRRLSIEKRRELWEAVKAANPNSSEREWQVEFVRNNYGEENAIRFEAALKERGLWNTKIRSTP
ncbi:hypothetical protein EON80_26140 [bacterium]|nr:MAG: hypothetical protein EON80_26140 [bacterium]